jgi:glycosyltransferase 2 family protein
VRETLTQASPLGMLRLPYVRVAMGALGVGAIVFALLIGWGDLQRLEWEFRPVPILTTFVLLFAVTVGEAALWVFTCRGIGGRIALRPGIRAVLLSNLGKYLPGKVMHVVSQVMLAQDQGVPAPTSLTSMLVDLALLLMGACFVSLFSLPTLLEDYRAALIPIAAIALPVGLIVLHPAILGRLLELGARVLPGSRAALTRELLPYPSIIKLFIGYCLSWLLMSVALFAAADAVHPLDLSLLPAMGGVATISYVFGLLVPFAPAGLGAREGAAAFMLATMMPLPAAAATSVLYRVLGILAEAAAAAVGSRL